MSEHNVLLTYKGTISQDALVGLGEFIRDNLFLRDAKKASIKKIFYIFIEMAQNILRYSDERITDVNNISIGIGIILVSETDKYYTITSANIIDSSKVSQIEDRCNHINSLEKDALKEFFNKQKKLPIEKDAKGPRLGLINIVRKTSNPIEYKSTKIDDSSSFLILSIAVNK
jgi:hypothetical protein